MNCYHSAAAVIKSGFTGYLLIITVKVHSGFVPADLVKGTPPFDPENVFPVTIRRSVPDSPTLETIQVEQNLSDPDEFEYVEIFCENEKVSSRISIVKSI